MAFYVCILGFDVHYLERKTHNQPQCVPHFLVKAFTPHCNSFWEGSILTPPLGFSLPEDGGSPSPLIKNLLIASHQRKLPHCQTPLTKFLFFPPKVHFHPLNNNFCYNPINTLFLPITIALAPFLF